MMRQYVYEELPLDELKEHFDAIESSGYSVSLFTDWQKQRINEVWIKSRDRRRAGISRQPEFFGAKLATRNLHPIAELSAENCTEQMGVPGPWYERLPHFRMGFTPSAGKELQSEYFVPRQTCGRSDPGDGAPARSGEPVSADHRNSHHRRRPSVDESMLRARRVTIHFTWKPDWPAVSKLLPVIERNLPRSTRARTGESYSQLRQRNSRAFTRRCPISLNSARKNSIPRKVSQPVPEPEYLPRVGQIACRPTCAG